MIIGLTGQTGAGKSTAAEILKAMGYFIIDADKIGHEVTASPEILAQIQKHFGEETVQDGRLMRRILGRAVFADGEKLALLNSLTHPAIIKKIVSLAKEHSSGAVIDCALLQECGLDALCHKIINITAPARVRQERIMLRDSLSPQEALNRINSQSPFRGECILIENNGDINALEKKLKEALCKENPTVS